MFKVGYTDGHELKNGVEVCVTLFYQICKFVVRIDAMKTLRFILVVCFSLFSALIQAQTLRTEVFDLLNLDYPGLEKVKDACGRQQWKEAAELLLDYYRNRSGIVYPDLDLEHIKASKRDWQWADDALEHTFLYTKDISLLSIMAKI